MFIPTYRVKFLHKEGQVGVSSYEVVPRHILVNVDKIIYIDTISIEANNQKFNEICLETNINKLSYLTTYEREEDKVYISAEDLIKL